jgi:hypothetical protein
MRLTTRLALVALMALLAATVLVGEASAHRSGCHSHHTCPSDHDTYSWNGWWCVSPASGESRAGFPHRIRYGGRTYYCRRHR